MSKPALISDRERERAVRQADRGRLRKLAETVAELRRGIGRTKIESRKKRRELLSKMRRDMRAIPRRDRASVRERVIALAAERERFQRWWAAVLQERAQRRATLAELRAQLRSYKVGAKTRLATAVTRLRELQQSELERFEQGRAELSNAAELALQRVQQELATERRDQRQFTRTKRHVKARSKRATRRERSDEFTGGVEVNLLTALEHAVWKREKGRILSNARARGITAPDAIAELVRERAESEEDLALEYLADDSEDWLRAELRKQGYE